MPRNEQKDFEKWQDTRRSVILWLVEQRYQVTEIAKRFHLSRQMVHGIINEKPNKK
jgi:hypothetical protein